MRKPCLTLIALGMSLSMADAEVRRPVDLAYLPASHGIVTANRASGSLSFIDLESMTCVDELLIGERITSVAAVPESECFLATDEAKNEVLLIEGRDVIQRVNVGQGPVRARISSTGARAAVASLWARSVTLLDIDVGGEEGPRLDRSETVELPFSPQELAWIPGNDRVLVLADALGGNLAVLGPENGEIRLFHSMPGHNIRGMTVSPDGKTLAISHQRLHSVGQTTIGDIHWGNLMGNHLRLIEMRDLLRQKGDPVETSHLIDLGGPDRGAGDPGAIAYTAEGRLAVCLSGVHEIAIASRSKTGEFERISAGNGPAAMVALPQDDRLFVANTFSDSISVIDVKNGEVEFEIRLSEDASVLSAEQRGEQLFHDATLSLDGWFSCHSCHTNGHSNGELADTLGDGGFGAPKRVLSLFGVGDTGPWAWRGDVEHLEKQIQSSVALTMRGERSLTGNETADLAAYLRSLAPVARADGEHTGVPIAQGAAVFKEQNCDRCHQPPEYTSAKSYDVDLADENGVKEFNPPSLRGARVRSRFFHDGRAHSLEEVFLMHKHQVGESLTETDIRDLVAFLRSL